MIPFVINFFNVAARTACHNKTTFKLFIHYSLKVVVFEVTI